MKLITLVRHGQASFGAENYDQLSPKGIAQTQWLGDSFRQSGRQVDAVISGEMARQQDSLRHFLSHYYVSREGIELSEITHHIEHNPHSPSYAPLALPSQLGTDSGFNEFNHEQVLFKANLGFSDKRSFIAYLTSQPQPELKFAELFTQAMNRWQGGEHDSDYDESWQGFLSRTWQGFERLIARTEDGKHSMAFTSGGVIASIVQQVMKLSDAQAFDLNWHIANASVHTFVIKEKEAVKEKELVKENAIFLQTFNEFSYLYQQGEQMVTWR
ncbi:MULTISPECIES: histidine phosphatase family protein [unclassified Moraxella]|uniref:histidine phosphatase family protein n=1 Tax=unclassified Moraxella TaxID=2685852 RepID=UPI003AF62C32